MSGLRTFEIYFKDLTEEAQKRYLSFLHVKDVEEGNVDLEVIPIASVDVEEDEDSNIKINSTFNQLKRK